MHFLVIIFRVVLPFGIILVSYGQSTEFQGGKVTNEKIVFEKSKSPYWLRNDIIIERDAEVTIEPGVQINVEPQVGITVRGVLRALGSKDDRIVLTSTGNSLREEGNLPNIRLVDGPSILAGRLQLKHNGEWRSVCSNSKNWTVADMETACRQLGFQGGAFFNWYDRQMPLKPRLLYEEPNCVGHENSLVNCKWSSRQLGSGVCDYHPDIGLQCAAIHDQSLQHWRGISYEYANSEKTLLDSNTLYISTSLSSLVYVQILNAGAGRNQNATSAVQVLGVPPVMKYVEILNSAYNAINITNPYSPVIIDNCTIRNNRGHGVFINSSYGLAQITDSVLSNNGGDGIRYVHADDKPDTRLDRSGYQDLCNLASTFHQIYPLDLYAEQSIYMKTNKICEKVFTTRVGQVITLELIRIVTSKNETSQIEIYDGSSLNNRIITELPIKNNTHLQTVTSTSNQMFVRFSAQPRTNTVIFLRILSGFSKIYDLNVTKSEITENLGRGVAIDNLKSQVHIHKADIAKNEHAAGIHVTSGVGDINVTYSKVYQNIGDGINITYTGGNRNISKSNINSNQGYGVAIWLNQTKETEYEYVNQSTVIQYCEIYKNLEVGVLHGNFCGSALFNFSQNTFRSSLNDGLEIIGCWNNTNSPTRLIIANNNFLSNDKIALKIFPAVNFQARIEYNNFRFGNFGQLLIKNPKLERFNTLPTEIVVHQNYFQKNNGIFVVNIALSPYSNTQNLLFTKNFVKDNKIKEPFLPEDGSVSNLNPRSKVAAPIVIGSSNVEVFRNIIENPGSKYEIGSHLEDQSKTINCTFNWLGFSTDKEIFFRLFHRSDRYNLAKILYIPFLLHNTNTLTSKYGTQQLYVPKFSTIDSNNIGGEIEGEETLSRGDYTVEKDINIRPGGKLTIEPGVTLRFPPCIGMLVAGRLEAQGLSPDSIKMTLKSEISFSPENVSLDNLDMLEESHTEEIPIIPQKPIRLLGGPSENEGRLQVSINNEWGTVCDYGWTLENAAVVCHQLGFVLNPDDWKMERVMIPEAGTNEPILLSNVQCTEYDMDITKCKAENMKNFENSCTHANDVGVKCYKTSWAGIRFAGIADSSNLQYLTIEKAGLLDYTTNIFKPAIQLDFARHNFENLRVVENFYDGFGVIYSDIYTDDSVNTIKNSEFTNNLGAGLSFKQFGFSIYNSFSENNRIGIRHDSSLSALDQRELAGWFINQDENSAYNPYYIPSTDDTNIIKLENGQRKYIVTQVLENDNIVKSYNIRCQPGWVLGIQLLNPPENKTTEQIIISDALTYNSESDEWLLDRDLATFPTTSSSHGIILKYSSGSSALGGTVLVLSSVRAPIQTVRNRIVKGAIPTLAITNSKIRKNRLGIQGYYYNLYLDDLGNRFLRKANETIKLIGCEISHNEHEAFYFESPRWDLHSSNLSETIIMLNNSLITDNGKGFYHFSRDMRQSNNIFHYVLQDTTIERNREGGFDISLPYVWQYNENFTHSVFIDNCTCSNNKNFGISIDGHFARVNITRSRFNYNNCKRSLLQITGMEKNLLIAENKFNNNFGSHIIEFSINSQTEIIGDIPAKFVYNELKQNNFTLLPSNIGSRRRQMASSVILFNGIQKVNVNKNLFSHNSQQFQLLAGVTTAKINNVLNVRENWWGTDNETIIREQIFDFNDWNNFAIADYKPYLSRNDFEASISISEMYHADFSFKKLGGQVFKDLTIPYRSEPYLVYSDITIMPNVTLTIHPNVILEFMPNVGILVLGNLKAQGYKGEEITMRPVNPIQLQKEYTSFNFEQFTQPAIRLCKNRNCQPTTETTNEGFLEYFNKTTFQWIPICDARFTERNAEVVCRELGYSTLNVFFDFDIRIDFHSNSLSRIWMWPEPLQCQGSENKFEECPIRLNGQQFGHYHKCYWNSKFVFINCGNESKYNQTNYWGGIRFAYPEFEQQLLIRDFHDPVTHENSKVQESILEFVNIQGAGILHNEKSPAVQSVTRSPRISYVNIIDSASHGINLVSPSRTMNLIHNTIQNSFGVGINILSVTGEGRDVDNSSYSVLRKINIPYHLFGLVNICDPQKEINIEEKMLLYYKYDNHPVSCIKIFRSLFRIKRLGLRLLQFNLFNSTNKYSIPDFLTVYDGDIFNVSSKHLGLITMNSGNENRFFKTSLPSISIKLFANGASSYHGFIAEVVTLPISAVGFNRDVQHNISYSVVDNNIGGGLLYLSSGEINPIITIEKNQFTNNCKKLYGNFTTCGSSVEMDIQNTESIFFRNNLLAANQGGLSLKCDSSSSATALKGRIQNNLFFNNTNLPALYLEGKQSSPYQEAIIERNYFTQNYAQYTINIILRQIVSHFSNNYIKRNVGFQNMEISGFDKVRLSIFQVTSHNGFYNNYALSRDDRSTIVAGTAGQKYEHNIFFNPDNDYDMVTANQSLYQFNSTLNVWNTKINAIMNYWSVNTTLAVGGRIKDEYDDPLLLQVSYIPFLLNNESILNDKKCPPGWNLVGQTCYIYVGAPMSFYEAKRFCERDNASMPYLLGNINYLPLYEFLKKQYQWYIYSEKVWVQHIDKINQCTMFVYQNVEVGDCNMKNSFICEIDPKVTIKIMPVVDDIVTIALVSSACVAIVLLIVIIAFWWNKSKYRKTQRLQRRDSIRASVNSLRSIGATPVNFADGTFRKKFGQMSSRSTDTLTRKMVPNGSIDSMEKTTCNSSADDVQSYDRYESFSTKPSGVFVDSRDYQNRFPNSSYDFGYKNDCFREKSSFASTSNSVRTDPRDFQDDDETPIIQPTKHQISYFVPKDYSNTDTLPLSYSGDRHSQFNPPESEIAYSDKMTDILTNQDYHMSGVGSPSHSNYSHMLVGDHDTNRHYGRAKSEMLLETNFDLMPERDVLYSQPISDSSRSKSQPLETSM